MISNIIVSLLTVDFRIGKENYSVCKHDLEEFIANRLYCNPKQVHIREEDIYVEGIGHYGLKHMLSLYAKHQGWLEESHIDEKLTARDRLRVEERESFKKFEREMARRALLEQDSLKSPFVIPKTDWKGGNNMREEKGNWEMFDVIMIDKEELKTVIDKRVIAKSPEHAKGKAGVFKKLEEKDFDASKFVIKVAHIAFVREVKDDE